MGATRARWFVGAEDEPAPAEPLSPSKGLTRIQDVAQPIDLQSEPKIRAELHATLRFEAELFNEGVGCDLKEDPQMTCATCPLRGQGVVDGRLCNVGVRQETLLSQLAVQTRAE